MDPNKYEFSAESMPLLIKYLDEVKESQCINKEASTWSKILPKNTHVLQQLDNIKSDSTDNIINISSDSIPEPTDNNSLLTNTNTLPEADESFNVQCLSAAIIKQFKNETLAEDMFDVLTTRNDAQIEDLMRCLNQQNLDSTIIYNLGFALTNYNSSKQNILLECFCRHLLIKMMKEEDSDIVANTFSCILDTYPQVLCSELAKNFIIEDDKECPRALFENLKKIKSEHKQQVLREFVLNCSKLKEGHFSIIDSLIFTQTDLGILKKIIDMFSASANEFSSNNSFGKLLFNVLQKVDQNVYKFEVDLRSIVTNHKSFWKLKIVKLFENNALQNNYSQIY